MTDRAKRTLKRVFQRARRNARNTYRMPGLCCPGCGLLTDASTAADRSRARPPDDGDFFICAYCATIAAVTIDDAGTIGSRALGLTELGTLSDADRRMLFDLRDRVRAARIAPPTPKTDKPE